jgi:hypothetical protein
VSSDLRPHQIAGHEMKFLKIGKSTVSEEGIHIPSRIFRKERFIPWENLKKIDQHKGVTRIWFDDGRLRIVSPGGSSSKKHNELMEYWEGVLLERTKSQGFLTGTALPLPPKKMWEDAIAVISSLLFLSVSVFMVIIAYKEWVKHAGIDVEIFFWRVLLTAFFYICWVCVINYRILFISCGWCRWKGWRIDRDGFYLGSDQEGWRMLTFGRWDCTGDSIITIGGEKIPWLGFSHYPIIPYLLTIHGRRMGIAPVFGRGRFMRDGLRLLFFWPPALSVMWFLPFVICGISWTYDPKMWVYLKIILCGCMFGGFLLLGVSAYESFNSIKNRTSFLAKVDSYQAALGWGETSRL